MITLQDAVAGPSFEELMKQYPSTVDPSAPGATPSEQAGGLPLSEILRMVQEQTDAGMKDPAFRKAVGIETPDPLAADKNGHNLPKTGVVNTTGALQRINARAQAEGTGVSAVMGDNGQLTLSNVGVSGRPLSTTGQSGQSPLQMASLISQLRSVNTPAEGNVIMDNIRSTVASEQAKLNAGALDFAANKLGIPSLEQQLTQSEANDKQSFGWFPGIGDSPGTARIRGTIQSMRAQAGVQADQFLATNLSSGILKTQLASAAEEMKRIEKKTDRADNLSATIDLRRADKVAAEEDANAALIDSVSSADMGNLRILIGGDKNDPKSLALALKAAAKNKPRMDAIQAASSGSDELLQLGVEGNHDARLLLLAQERNKNPLMDEDVFNMKMANITKFAGSEDFVKKSVEARFGNSTSKEAKQEILRLNSQRAGASSAADKAIDHKNRIAIAIGLERQQATNNFLDKTANWGITDPVFQQVVSDTMKDRGTADFASVVNNYMGDTTGPAAQAKLFALNAIVEDAFGRQKSSIFGRPDISAAKAMIVSKAKTTRLTPQYIPDRDGTFLY